MINTGPMDSSDVHWTLLTQWRIIMPMKTTFLHVADLHYRPDWHEETDLVCRKFLDDLAQQVAKYENLYLAFSGDLARSGADPNYLGLRARLEKGLETAGLPRARRICVPGNHDIDQAFLKALLVAHQGTLGRIHDETTFNDQLSTLTGLFFGKEFAQYREFETTFADFTCCSSGMGGTGWELPGGIGVFCLNTALCSATGLKDENGTAIDDKGKLMVDTRSLYKWLASTSSKFRILIQHHPLEWLSAWAAAELGKITTGGDFQLVLNGHIHEGSSVLSSRGSAGSVQCIAPSLFSRKGNSLGYAFVTVDPENGGIEVAYRQWTSAGRFVTGTGLSATDDGQVVFSGGAPVAVLLDRGNGPPTTGSTRDILQAEFDDAATHYSSKRQLWISRDIADRPETAPDADAAVIFSQDDLVTRFRSSILRGPKEFGLTCLGRYIALEFHRRCNGQSAVLMLDFSDVRAQQEQIIEAINARSRELHVSRQQIAGFIVDGWQYDRAGQRIVKEIRREFPTTPMIILESLEVCSQITSPVSSDVLDGFEALYLWSLTRSRVRELIKAYLAGAGHVDEDMMTKKVVSDLEALNIHRTPHNCLVLTRLAEQAFDDSPVNRTEMLDRFLHLLFLHFDAIPTYATRPDLKDCEYALGYFCEYLMRAGRHSFAKSEFFAKVQEYCSKQLLELDVDILFAFLATEHVIVRHGIAWGFRFTYWLYFFAAHRMHHDPQFAEFILSNRRYAAFPEIIEFYAGIDRRRGDAIFRLTADLKEMNQAFLQRTGIPADFDPMKDAMWTPDEQSLKQLEQRVKQGATESALPASVKDAIADTTYNRAQPYRQELATFLDDSTLVQLIQSMRGAARALRNSDHVQPEAKVELLDEVIRCWVRVYQILFIISPVLATERRAAYEGMGFYLDKTWDSLTSPEARWRRLMTVIIDNVVRLYHEDVFSRKMGPLLARYANAHSGELGQLMVILMMIRQAPQNWFREVERYVVSLHKNSFYLSRVCEALMSEYRLGFVGEKNREELKRLTTIVMAKHAIGVKHPNLKLIEQSMGIVEKELTRTGPRLKPFDGNAPASKG